MFNKHNGMENHSVKGIFGERNWGYTWYYENTYSLKGMVIAGLVTIDAILIGIKLFAPQLIPIIKSLFMFM